MTASEFVKIEPLEEAINEDGEDFQGSTDPTIIPKREISIREKQDLNEDCSGETLKDEEWHFNAIKVETETKRDYLAESESDCEFCESTGETSDKEWKAKKCRKQNYAKVALVHTKKKRRLKPVVRTKCDVQKMSKNLKDHVSTVDKKKKQFKCPLCPKYFSYNNSVRVHLRTHSNERPFVCDICNDSFTKNSYLVRHKTTHLIFKPYHCQLCSNKYRRRDHVRAHIQRFHQKIHVDDIGKYILYETPKPSHISNIRLAASNGSNAKKTNMIGEPLRRKGRPPVKNGSAHRGSVVPKGCSVVLTPIDTSLLKSGPTVSKIPKNDTEQTEEGVETSTKIDEGTRVLNNSKNHSIKDASRRHRRLINEKSNGSNGRIRIPALKCVFCGKSFSSSTDLVSHYSSHSQF